MLDLVMALNAKRLRNMRLNYEESACKYLIIRVYKLAASDYVCALRRAKRIREHPGWMDNPKLVDRAYSTLDEIERIEHFFTDDPYGFLGDGVGVRIIRELRDRVSGKGGHHG